VEQLSAVARTGALSDERRLLLIRHRNTRHRKEKTALNHMRQATKQGVQFGVSLLPHGPGEIEVTCAADVAEPLHELMAERA
jgi:hypothetical protein